MASSRTAAGRRASRRKPATAGGSAVPAKKRSYALGAGKRKGATTGTERGASRSARAGRLPSWKELGTAEARPAARSREHAFLETISTARFALLILALAAGFTLYVGHVHATQDLLAEVQSARRDNLRLHLKYNRLKGDFDRATGPAVIYERARALGLEESIEYGPTIRMAE